MKKALIVASVHWDSPLQVGTHMLARGLVDRGWVVGFVSNPISPFHFLFGLDMELRARLEIYKKGGMQDLNGRLWAYVPGALVIPHNKPLFRSRWVHEHWQRLSFPRLIPKLEQKALLDVDLLYFDNGSQPFLLDTVKARRIIYRMTDNNAAWNNHTAELERSEQRIIEQSDVVLYTAQALRQRALDMGARQSIHFPNGVDLRHFEGKAHDLPEAMRGIPGPIAIYVGGIGERFDFALVKECAMALPEVSFVLIGPASRKIKMLANLSNVHHLGAIPYSDIPKFLHHADVGLIPFDLNVKSELVAGVNPLKLYQYFSCGLPVVSVEWAELKGLNSPAILAKTTSEFINAITSCLRTGSDAAAYLNFAKEHDWAKRVELLESLALG